MAFHVFCAQRRELDRHRSGIRRLRHNATEIRNRRWSRWSTNYTVVLTGYHQSFLFIRCIILVPFRGFGNVSHIIFKKIPAQSATNIDWQQRVSTTNFQLKIPSHCKRGFFKGAPGSK